LHTNRWSRAVLVRAMVFLVPLVASIAAVHGHAAQGPDPKQVEHQAIPIMKGIIDGIAEGDYQTYTKDFSDTMRKSADRESFLQLQSNLSKHAGTFKSFKYIGFYVQEGFVITLFKARFSKEKDDVLVNLVLDGRTEPKVTGLWFDAPSLRGK
jgi:hypothetical protein